MSVQVLKTLDNVIAVVVVILILALIVQSSQSFLKKLFSIKSKQIGDSLVELLEQVVGKGKNCRPSMRTGSPVWRMLTHGKAPSDFASPEAKALFTHVVESFKKLGRVSPRGEWVTESISKADLLKVIASVSPDTMVGGFTAKLVQVCKDATDLRTRLAAVSRDDLPGGASAQLARVEAALTPLFSDCESLLDGGGAVRAGVVLEEVLRVSTDALDPALTALASIQTTIAEARKSADSTTGPKLDAVAAALREVARAISAYRASFEKAFAPVQARLVAVGNWFDTVMQSFEERYTRGMRTWSLVISAVLVVLLNANLFQIYETIAANDVLAAQLVEKIGPELQKQRAADQPKADGAAGEALEKEHEKTKAGVRQYLSLGLTPFTWEDLSEWSEGFFYREGGPGDPSGLRAWFGRRAEDLRTLFGWFLMVILLSFGAPFWHDALETLFGVKNLVRKRGDIRNVETPSGAGNPKP